MLVRKDANRKRPSSREPKLLRRREIQRTIDRLQPGKSKGNLLTNITNKNQEKPEETLPVGALNKIRDLSKAEESSPKLSLGSVLPSVEFALGSDHNFRNNEDIKSENLKETTNAVDVVEKEEPQKKPEDESVQPNKKDVEVETEPPVTTKPNQEKATPNLSAWFKAFGAPKNTTNAALPIPVKKKLEDTETEEKHFEVPSTEQKVISPKNNQKFDSPTDTENFNPDGGDSPLPNVITTPRQRKTSTGSSVSERSSFSQDLDSPRHQMSHTSPLLRSPASPRTDDFQKITYPIINGTVRAGFYHDTTSMKSSPEKSCSPRESPLSPYSPYSQHVYASNSITGSSTPNYFVDHNRSPLSASYTQNPLPFYDTSKVAAVNKLGHAHEDYTLGPDAYPQNQYTGPFSAYSPYTQTSNYSQAQQSSPQTTTNTTSTNSIPVTVDNKPNLFPVKKRMYNEPETLSNVTKSIDGKDTCDVIQNKNETNKIVQSLHSISTLPSSTPSVDEIALALSEKSEMAKLNNIRDIATREYTDGNVEKKEPVKFENDDSMHSKNENTSTIEINKAIGIIKDNIDMINMGYLNPEVDRRNNTDSNTNFLPEKDSPKTNINTQQKSYEVEAINLGINNQPIQKTISKTTVIPNNIPAAHSQERTLSDANLNQNIPHAHHNQYESASSSQPVSNFSMNDIEMANKNFYANSTTSSGSISYSNWKVAMRKQEALASVYSASYTNTAEKLMSDISSTNANVINYNKTAPHQQYNTYNIPRTNLQRTQEIQQNLPSELRIPNPRSLLKNDLLNAPSTLIDTNLTSKSIDTHTSSHKPQKSEKIIQNHPLVTSNPYKAPYSNHSTLPMDSLRNLPSIPQMLERFPNDERYLGSFSSNASSVYHDKTFQMAQMFSKSMPSDVHSTSTPVTIYAQPSLSINKDSIVYQTCSMTDNPPEVKYRLKRKRTSDIKQVPPASAPNYHTTEVLSPVKSNIIPASAFNFGTSSNMALSGSLYPDNTGFTIEDFRNNTANQLMAANYMVAAVAHQQRNAVDVSTDKLVKPAHQNSTHATSSFPFMGHSQVRAGYPFVGADPTSPLYQQLIQRRQEELFRQTGAQIMSLYPSGYPAAGLSVRQPYDSINRPSWL